MLAAWCVLCRVVYCVHVGMWQRRGETRQAQRGRLGMVWHGLVWYGMARHSLLTEWMDDIGRQRLAGRQRHGRQIAFHPVGCVVRAGTFAALTGWLLLTHLQTSPHLSLLPSDLSHTCRLHTQIAATLAMSVSACICARAEHTHGRCACDLCVVGRRTSDVAMTTVRRDQNQKRVRSVYGEAVISHVTYLWCGVCARVCAVSSEYGNIR